MRHELEERALPDRKIRQPVAGYLYFPKLKKAKNAAYQIIFFGANPKLTLAGRGKNTATTCDLESV
jgi:hypothetical protein